MARVTLDSVIGCILGTAVGDALGLPLEGLSPRKAQHLTASGIKHRLFFGKGMVSDDTEHLCMVAQCLIVSAGNEQIFTSALAWRLRWWLLGLPVAIGYATLRAIVKLWLGFSPQRSGVFSAGNGPAMRGTIIGLCYGHNPDKLSSLVKASTRITHTDPKAEYGVLAVAIAAYLASKQELVTPHSYYQALETLVSQEAQDFLRLIKKACTSAEKRETAALFAVSIGLERGISGYMYHTVPVVIQIWLRHQDNYRNGITEIIRLGGDTDTTAAILGGILGAAVGKQGIPKTWLDNLWEYPRNPSWMEKLGERLVQVCTSGTSNRAMPLAILFLFPRNCLFLLIVICHIFWRLSLFTLHLFLFLPGFFDCSQGLNS
jgi:ADP-ribosylglycohydrolase